MDWYAPLRGVISKGSCAEWDGTLAGLHVTRRAHAGQFFTPDAVVRFLWRVTGLDRLAVHPMQRVAILDNSFGSGRMFQLADPNKHALAGIEEDADLVRAVRETVQGAGFRSCLQHGSLERFRCQQREFDIALVNPPFSLHFDSSLAEPYSCNTFGKFGPRSSAFSHSYALAQALHWSRYVAAVLPRSFVASVRTDPFFSQRLKAILHLPAHAFLESGASIDTSVLLWDRIPLPEDVVILEERFSQLEKLPGLPYLDLDLGWNSDTPIIRQVDQDDSQPAVTLPVTHDRTVGIAHNGRHIVLTFRCAIAQARVLNWVRKGSALHQYHGKGHRMATGIEWLGQGQLDLECYLIQRDPVSAFDAFVAGIAHLGFEPQVDAGLRNHLCKRIRQDAMLRAPLRHVVKLDDGGLSRWLHGQLSVQGHCKVAFPIWRNSWGKTSQVNPGDAVQLSRDTLDSSEWTYTHNQCCGRLSTDELLLRFDLPDFIPLPNDWTVIHEGLSQSYPVLFQERMKLALSLGLDRWCSWEYQLHDLVEMSMKRGHLICAWEMSLGKARLAAALCLLGCGKHNLICVEAHLIQEMLAEFRVLGLVAGQFQVIEKPVHLKTLRQINLIAYSRLKSSAGPSTGHSYAKKLRRRCHTVICDEGHLLRNPQTEQSRAVWQLSPKVRYALSGTPVANYPRDVLPLIQWVAGDGTAVQPYGRFHPMLEPVGLQDASKLARGVDRFRSIFVDLQWVTNEFAEDLRQGAKREIPRIKDVRKFRDLMAPFMKRRILEEPEVARHIRMPRAVRTVTEIPWDREHLAYYVAVAREFVDWFKKLSDWEKKSVGLIAILAKLQAVFTAANYPQHGVANQGVYPCLTSKQRLAIERVTQWVTEGHKVIVLAYSPDVVRFLGRHLQERSIAHVPFHGEISIADRVKTLDSQFRHGSVPVLLATKGVLQTGYNIHQASRVLFYDRSWTPKIEMQAAARVLRPQQTKPVIIEYLHLAGSIDTYQAQMVECKGEAMVAGLDYGQEDPERTFLHIETILGRFVAEFEDRMGVKMDNLIASRTSRATA